MFHFLVRLSFYSRIRLKTTIYFNTIVFVLVVTRRGLIITSVILRKKFVFNLLNYIRADVSHFSTEIIHLCYNRFIFLLWLLIVYLKINLK